MRLTAAACLAASGVVHAQLYVQGYRAIPYIGIAFLAQALGSALIALLLLAWGAPVIELAGAALSASALGAFVLSRTVGVFGFVEHGLVPAPQALLSVVTEAAALGILAVSLLARRPATRQDWVAAARPRAVLEARST